MFQKAHISGLRKGANNNEEIWLSQNNYKRTAFRQHGIEWELKGAHEEHLDVYNSKRKNVRRKCRNWKQEKENLTAENEA